MHSSHKMPTGTILKKKKKKKQGRKKKSTPQLIRIQITGIIASCFFPPFPKGYDPNPRMKGQLWGGRDQRGGNHVSEGSISIAAIKQIHLLWARYCAK